MTTEPIAPATTFRAAEPAPVAGPAGLTFAVVPHTHWDREWYLPFEVFRLRLVRVVEQVLEVLEADPRMRFTLDGQAAIVDDVLELRPDLRDRIAARARSGQLALGPAYTQQDELLSDGETLVRNLLLGRAVVRGLGVAEMGIGYHPDVFGHTAQLPQMLRGFGLDGVVAWRGLGDEVDRVGPVFRWMAPDGSWVHFVRQLDGYGGGSMLGEWTESGVRTAPDEAARGEAVARRFERFVQRWEAAIGRSPVAHVALANGGDHHSIQPELPALLDAAQAAHPRTGFEITRYDELLDGIRGALDADPLPPTVHGELLGAREAFVLRGVNSTRMPLKLAHERTERGLRTAETLSVLALLARPVTAPAWPGPALVHAWRELLRNTPHDSITGCSTDAVHRTMEDRYARADQVTDRLRAEAIAALVGRDAPWEFEAAATEHRSIVNPLPVARREIVRMPLPASLAGEHALVADRPSGAVIAQVDADREAGPAPAGSALVVLDLPAWGATSVTLRRGTIPPGSTGTARAVDARTIETARFRLRVLDGAFALEDRLTGRRWDRLAWLEDTGDRGDSYTFRAIAGEPWTSLGCTPRVRVGAAGPDVVEIEAAYVARLPRRLGPDGSARSVPRVRVPVVIRARLAHGIDRVELDVLVDNRAEDHRLRLRVDDPEPASVVLAGSPFAVVARPPGPVSDGEGWAEVPEATAHMAGFVAAGSIAVMAPGLAEYEAIPRSDGGLDLAVTLLRCVGVLGRDLPSRMGGAGPEIAVPDAQCPGRHAFRLALAPARDAADELRTSTSLAREAQAVATPFELGPAGTHRPPPLALEGEDLVFSALKAAEDDDGFILRAWNADAQDVGATVAGPGIRVERCRLDETPLPDDEASSDLVGACAIATWRIRPA
ncbi:MAG TPA: glycosyl hydrolase-related protein [Candidatus Limnocylindrales bacterium]|nr:glycosyl hydrolase-related protein [Candidatus Limnocylindrales bacterium]